VHHANGVVWEAVSPRADAEPRRARRVDDGVARQRGRGSSRLPGRLVDQRRARDDVAAGGTRASDDREDDVALVADVERDAAATRRIRRRRVRRRRLFAAAAEKAGDAIYTFHTSERRGRGVQRRQKRS
jgi:hypothetical protein